MSQPKCDAKGGSIPRPVIIDFQSEVEALQGVMQNFFEIEHDVCSDATQERE